MDFAETDGSLLFYSKSKHLTNRYLSNFTNISAGIMIPETFPLVELIGYRFPSIENAFQAAKYCLAGSLKIALELRHKTPSESKSMGSKSGMKKCGIVLDVIRWNQLSYPIMLELVRERLKCDELYRLIAKYCVENKIKLKHFERSGDKSFWGGYFKNGIWYGYNSLGRIIEIAASEYRYKI